MTDHDHRYEARVTDLDAGTWTARPFGSPYEAAGHLGANLTAAGYEADKGWGIRLAEGEAIQHHHRRYEVLETTGTP